MLINVRQTPMRTQCFKMNAVNTNVSDQNANVNQEVNPLGRKNPKNLNSNSNPNPAEKAKIIFVPAGNNSEIGTTMGDDGEFLEIRVFKSDKNLLKTIRKVTAKKITVYLKNGKTVEIDESKISQHSSASPEEILIAAGVLQKPDSAATGGK